MKLFYFISLAILASLCGCVNYSHSVYQAYDHVKQEQLRQYELNLYAKSLLKNTDYYDIHLDFRNRQKTDRSIHFVAFNLDISPNIILQDTIYFMLDSKTIPIPLKSISYSLQKNLNTNTQTKVIESNKEKENDKDKETKIITEVDTTEWEYNHTSASAFLSSSLVNKLNESNEFDLRIYLDQKAYTIHVNSYFTARIKQVYLQDNTLNLVENHSIKQ